MPILVRPVREQLEHDRIIRLLEAKWRRKFKVDANPGDERNVGVKVPVGTLFPDLILTDEGGRKPKALVEVETNESVNHLEAMAQWAHLAKSKTALSLIVPIGAVEAARRLASENGIKLTEVWTYHVLGDQVRFTSVFREHGADPADLIEKVEAFTTERAAPAPRPVPVETAEAVEPPGPAEVERPRKLAVKAGSRPVVDGAAAKMAPKVATVATRVAAKAPAIEPPAPASKPAVAVKASAAKVEAAPAKPAVAPKAVAAAKPAAPVKPVAPVKPAPPIKPSGPVKVVASGKPATSAKAVAAPAKPAPPKPADKGSAKKAAAKPEVKKAAPAKAAPPKPAAKPLTAVRKPTAAARPAPRPAARKAAAPVRPAPRVAAAKKAAPVAKARPAKRK